MNENSKVSKIIEDIKVHDALNESRIHLVASENSLHFSARVAFLSDVINRYYFPLEQTRNWAFPGNEQLESIHTKSEEYIRNLLQARFVNIRPISGINAMTVALAGLTESGDKILSFSQENGGHSITSAIAKRLGLTFLEIPYDQNKFTVDIEELSKIVKRNNVKLLYLDQCHVLFPPPVTEIKKSVGNTTVYYDGSHIMGLIFGGKILNPLEEGADLLGGNTHKTIPGPHKAFIATNNQTFFKKITEASYTFVSHDHVADIAALGIVLELMEKRWNQYAENIVKNAQSFGKQLKTLGFFVSGEDRGYTQTHQIWVSTEPFMDAFDAVKRLAKCGIITNTFEIPGGKGKLSLRVGVQELTFLGATIQTFEQIAGLFKRIIIDKLPDEDSIGKEIGDIKKNLLVTLRSDLLHTLLEESPEEVKS